MSSEPGIDTGRFGRTLVLIGFVTTVFLFLIAERLSGDTFQIGAIAIGTVALITAITGFLIAAGSAVEGH
ncbi:hypothetical protein DJ79_04745 [Halorubrum ezzemoulense]|uniref:Uncharacterized protein n=1 Tax=Halorubrum ezzemoulense TaxID=337243 RepID=A0A256JJ91_HALEZ|nr:hypothetical protein [Halorubrum ezzemoulense]OYR68928.1 hypothetical protein DJ79_04745 [Halorubrum ezzemoulense]